MNAAVRLFLFAFLLATILNAQSTPKNSLLALSKKDQTLAIVDPASLKILAKVPVGNDPHEVIASTDGRTAYVSNYGGGAYNTLAVVDLLGQKPLPQIDLGPLRGPHGLDFVGGKVWFTAEAADAVGSYDPATKNVDWILGTGQKRTHMILVSQDMRRVISTNVSSGTVSIMEKLPQSSLSSARFGGDWEVTVVPVGRGSEGFDLSPDGKELWVANAQDGTISIVNPAEKKVIDTLAANVQGANRLKFTPDGARVFVSSLRLPHVVVLDAHSRKEVKRIQVGHGAAGILMQPDGAGAFVACSPDNYVAVIDLKSLEVTRHLDVGTDPDGLAWSSMH